MSPSPTQLRPSGASHFVAVGLGVLALTLVDLGTAWLLETAGFRFPSFVAAMMGLFVVLSLGRLVTAPLVDRVVEAAAPAATFLGRWMALFFVPPLVLLALNEPPRARDFVLLIVIGGGGFVATFWVAGALARACSVRTDRLPVAHANPRPPWKARTLLGLWGSVTMMSGLVWWLTALAQAKLVLGVGLSVVGFVAAEAVRHRLADQKRHLIAALAHPVLISAGFTALLWRGLGFELEGYLREANSWAPGAVLAFFLRPAVVALGFALDTQRALLRAQVLALTVASSCAAVFALLATACAAGAMGLAPAYARALLPRSVTTPVALSMANYLGADPGLTAVVVILTGVLGALLSPFLASKFGLSSPFVHGVATGASSHGIGTAALARDYPIAAAFSGITFALMAIVSVALVSTPWVCRFLLTLVE